MLESDPTVERVTETENEVKPSDERESLEGFAMYHGLASVDVSAQGEVFRCQVHDPDRNRRRRRQGNGGKRGKVGAWISNASRKSCVECMARIEPSAWRDAMEVGITTRRFLSRLEWANARNALERRVKRVWPGAGVIWVTQRQARGALHEHMIVWGTPGISKKWLFSAWRAVLGEELVIVHVEPVRSARQARGYLSRYLVRDALAELAQDAADAMAAAAPGEDAVLDPEAYSAGDEEGGRWWGCWGRRFVPWADLFTVSWELKSWFYQLRRCARRKWRGVSRRGGCGFMLLTEDVASWMALAAYFKGRSVSPG